MADRPDLRQFRMSVRSGARSRYGAVWIGADRGLKAGGDNTDRESPPTAPN